MVRIFVGALAAAVLMFFVGFLAFPAMPAGVHGIMFIPDDRQAALLEALRNLQDDGIYVYPHEAQANAESALLNDPCFSIAYRDAAPLPMVATMGMNFVHFFVSALLLAILNWSLGPATFGGRLQIAVVAGIFAALLIDIGPIIWWHAPPHFHLYNTVYHIAAALAGGVALAAIVKRPAAAPAAVAT